MASFVASNRYPLVYHNVSKAGCTSTKNWLYKLDYGVFLDPPGKIHQVSRNALIHHDFDPRKMEEKFGSSLVFTFVRHPLRRAYSTFNQKILGTESQFQSARRLIESAYGAELSRPRTLGRHRADFLAFLLFARDTAHHLVEHKLDWHWAPQTFIVGKGIEVRPFDFIGRLERIDEEMAYICDRVGLPRQTLPRFNEGPPSPFSYDEVVTEEIRAIGRDFYRDDLRNFAYSI